MSAPTSPAPRPREIPMLDLSVPDSPKMLRESLCVAQTAIGVVYVNDSRVRNHIDRLQRLIDECDRHRPIGPDGKHGARHTPTCGCDRDEVRPPHPLIHLDELAYQYQQPRIGSFSQNPAQLWNQTPTTPDGA